MKRLFYLILAGAVLLVSLGGCAESPLQKEIPEDFSFALTWGVYGISSYDSKTGKLVKTKDATNPEDYVTYLELPEETLEDIYEMIRKLKPDSYPDEYDPDPYRSSDPSADLILTVRAGDSVKTITATEVSLSYETWSIKGKRYIDTCRAISEILTSTEEWQALPDYEFYYD
ncbi:MAG: hypothetical protein J6S71_01015 [Clostridia bacterium]|nr:hypothetical protein [Clostridia bacterium]